MDLSDNLESNVKLFTDDMSLFSLVRNPINISQTLKNDLHKVSLSANKWKISLSLYLIILPFNKYRFQKHSGIHLDEKLTFKHYINEKMNKANKGIGVIRKLNNLLPRSALATIYRSFIRPPIDYGDMIYDQPENESFSSKVKLVQYNSSLA